MHDRHLHGTQHASNIHASNSHASNIHASNIHSCSSHSLNLTQLPAVNEHQKWTTAERHQKGHRTAERPSTVISCNSLRTSAGVGRSGAGVSGPGAAGSRGGRRNEVNAKLLEDKFSKEIFKRKPKEIDESKRAIVNNITIDRWMLKHRKPVPARYVSVCFLKRIDHQSRSRVCFCFQKRGWGWGVFSDVWLSV